MIGKILKNRKAFTLIEVMISVVLMGIIISYLYGTLGGLRHSNQLLEERDAVLGKGEIFLNLINRDLLESKKLNIRKEKSENSVLELTTKNSLYDSHFVYVKWFLNLEENVLVRAESPKDFKLPVLMEKQYLVRFDILVENVDMFKVYKSKDKKSLLISTKDINTTKIFAIELMNRN